MSEDSTTGTMLWIIVGIVGVLLIAAGIYGYQKYFGNAYDESTCYQSIETHTELLTMSKAEIAPDIKCPTRSTHVSAQSNDQQVDQQIANAWVQCWREWHRGQADLFQTEGSYCHVCNVFSFDNREKINGLYGYLQTHRVGLDSLVNGKQLFMIDYLSPYDTQQTDLLANVHVDPSQMKLQQVDQNAVQQSDTIAINKQNFAIVIIYAKGETTITKLLAGNRFALGIGGLGLAVGGIAGVGAGAAGVFFVSNPVGWIVGGTIVLGAGAIAIYEAVAGGKPPQIFSMSMFVPYTQDTLKDLHCDVLPVKQQ